MDRTSLSQAESVSAGRRWWDADAAAYQAEHGEFLGDADFVWCPEGLREAFANLYAELAQERMAHELKVMPPEVAYPRIEDGAHTMAFIEACIASHSRGGWVDVAPLSA